MKVEIESVINENNEIVGIDNWSEATAKLVADELKLPLPGDLEDPNNNKFEYDLSDSDVFSRIYSRINRSEEFSYVDNESYYEDTKIHLVYEMTTGGKATLSGDLSTENYKLEVVRD